MPKNNKKIFLFLAGGTCIFTEAGHIFSVKSQDDIEDWLAQMPELNILADIEPVFISGEDDLIGPNIWQTIAKEIIKRSEEADGFVIVSKIDQLINTSLALTFALQNLKKTIITTTSRISGSNFIDKKEVISNLKNKYGGLSLRSNLINAIQVAQQPLPAPAIMFGTRLIAATRAIFDPLGDVNVFSSISDCWGKVDFGINVKSNLKYNQQKAKIYSDKLADILVFDDIPGVPWSFDRRALTAYRGIFIKVDSYQKLGKNKQEQIIKWKMPIVLYNYHLTSTSKGAISVSNCTFNTALIKTMWALSNEFNKKDFENIMTQNIIEEFLN
ncbi:MAG: asparaginase domain-containing protein [Patescibacteria group bacterium]|jgi:hypothetical protein